MLKQTLRTHFTFDIFKLYFFFTLHATRKYAVEF